MAIIEKTGVFTYLDGDGNEVRLYPKSKNESSDAADAVISVLSSDWALDETIGMYKQDFTVNGITSESVPVIGLVPTSTPTPDSEAEAYSHITDAVTGDNTLTLYADEALTTAITIIVKGISATGGSTVADISNLTAKYNELNSNLADGQISFSVVDGEPYVKVGADSPRPFKKSGSKIDSVTGWGTVLLTFNNDNYTNLHVDNAPSSCTYKFLNSSGQGSEISFKGGEQNISIPNDCVTINITVSQYNGISGIEFS